MCGRAGRPQFDESGLVMIMTRKETVHLYENLLSGCEMVESQLLSSITEHLNAEIAQMSISDISFAIQWLKCSFLYVRIKQNPEHYSIGKCITSEQLEKRLKEICVQNINELTDYGMITTDEYGFILKPLEPGRLMARYYLRFNTMKEIMKAPNKSSTEDLLHIIAKSEELSWIQLRRNEKRILNDINTDKNGRLRYQVVDTNGKVKKRIQTREEKIFILANDSLSGDPVIHDLTLSQDVHGICSNGARIAHCMRDCFLFEKRYKEALNCMMLAKCMHQRLWDDSPYQLKQLQGIGMITAKALHLSGIDSFNDLEKADPRKLEIVTGRKYPFGDHIKGSLSSLPPKTDIKIEEVENKKQGNSKLMITLTRLSTPNPTTIMHFADLIVGTEEDNHILFHERIRLDEFSSPYTVTVFISTSHNADTIVTTHLVSESYVGVDMHEKITCAKRGDAKKKSDEVKLLKTMKCKLPVKTWNQRKKEEKLKLTPPSKSATPRIKKSTDMPTFELLGSYDVCEETQDKSGKDPDIQVVENEMQEKPTNMAESVLHHIRQKTRNLPSFKTYTASSFSNDQEVLLSPQKLDLTHPASGFGPENCCNEAASPIIKRTKEVTAFETYKSRKRQCLYDSGMPGFVNMHSFNSGNFTSTEAGNVPYFSGCTPVMSMEGSETVNTPEKTASYACIRTSMEGSDTVMSSVTQVELDIEGSETSKMSDINFGNVSGSDEHTSVGLSEISMSSGKENEATEMSLDADCLEALDIHMNERISSIFSHENRTTKMMVKAPVNTNTKSKSWYLESVEDPPTLHNACEVAQDRSSMGCGSVFSFL